MYEGRAVQVELKFKKKKSQFTFCFLPYSVLRLKFDEVNSKRYIPWYKDWQVTVYFPCCQTSGAF